MKKSSKILSLVLALTLVFALAACGKKSSTDTEKTTTAASTLNLEILYEKDDDMKNDYTLIAVDQNAGFVDADGNAVSDVSINTKGADALINWMLSDEGLKACSTYGEDTYGEALFTLEDDAPKATETVEKATDATKTIRLSTTTSVNDSGLLDSVLPVFEKKYGYKVEVTAAGTGKAIANAEAGNADLILVHAKAKEEDFVTAGYSRIVSGFTTPRLTFMYNYFVLVGPVSDPAKVKEAKTAKDAFKAIADTKSTFISRGDGSGTQTKELTLWPESLGITEDAKSFADYSWYVSADQGMGKCIAMANEKGAYILSDKATYLSAKNNYSDFLSNLDS